MEYFRIIFQYFFLNKIFLINFFPLLIIDILGKNLDSTLSFITEKFYLIKIIKKKDSDYKRRIKIKDSPFLIVLARFYQIFSEMSLGKIYF